VPRRVLIAISIVAVSCAANLQAEGIGTLVEAGKSMDSAKRELSEETASYERVRSAIESGALQIGQSARGIEAQYGKPVVRNEDFSTKGERWVYKPARSSFFEGARIYLYFDGKGSLAEIKKL
jgi:hypothetical protein